MMRSFFAISLPEEFREEISRLRDQLRPCGADVKYVRPESVHLTLKFLGDIPEAMATPLSRAVSQAASSSTPFDLKIQGVGLFPGPRRPRVIWLGLTGDVEKLSALRETVETVAEQFGFPREDRAFTPHLTLGRVRSPRGGDSLAANLNKLDPRPLGFTARELVLFQSILKPSGAVYNPLERIPFLGRI
ncbi:MAG: RNA 2',3'-cyclic phosphodiesterase [Pseudomonadota bacterium]